MASVSIDLGNDENIEFEQDEKWQEWLITHGHREEMYEVYYRHTFFSLVADFCSYMLESINCAAKMKVAVSYALLRKPSKIHSAILNGCVLIEMVCLICLQAENQRTWLSQKRKPVNTLH